MKTFGEHRFLSPRACHVVAMSLAFLVAAAGMPDRFAQAQQRVADEKPGQAEDQAEVQRRQQIKQQATHWEQQFTKLLHGDLELLRAVCGDLPRESRRAIAQAGQVAVKEAALRMAELQLAGRRNVRGRDGGANAGTNTDNPLAIVVDSLTKSVAERVGNEQATAYSQQLASRNDRRRTAQIREIVAMLDGELVLTVSQREEIERSLREKWDDSMSVSLQGVHVHNGVRVFPGLPRECISPHLTKAQRQRFVTQPHGQNEVWPARRQQAWMHSLNMLNNVPPIGQDPWWFE